MIKLMSFFSASCLLFCLLGAGDAPILFENPSFEGRVGADLIPQKWSSFNPGSTPDTQPGAWNVTAPTPKDGETFVGLIAREDGTVEDIAQRLPQKLEKGRCYIFSIWLAHAQHYSGFTMPLRLKVRGGTDFQTAQTLCTSGLIDGKEWQKVSFQFTASEDIQYLIFEADYAPGTLFKYKGNILLDHLSPIFRCDRA
jgi:Carbohydrate binding domain